MDTLHTTRLELRPPVVGDAPAFFHWVSDPELPRMMSWNAHASIDETVTWLEGVERNRAAGTDLVWAIVHDGRISGAVGLHGIARQWRAWRVDRAELGYWIAPPLHGRGLMTEAARAVVDYGFATLGLHKITVGCFDANVGSRRVIEKLGFELVGVRREHLFRDGRWWDHRDYDLLARDYGAQSSVPPSAR
jgi:ribosomal-protein-alanine N-acetyltransferase